MISSVLEPFLKGILPLPLTGYTETLDKGHFFTSKFGVVKNLYFLHELYHITFFQYQRVIIKCLVDKFVLTKT